MHPLRRNLHSPPFPSACLLLIVALLAGSSTALSCADQASATEISANENSPEDSTPDGESPFNGTWKPCESKVAADLIRFDRALEDAVESATWLAQVFEGRLRKRLTRLREHPERPDAFALQVTPDLIRMEVPLTGKDPCSIEAPTSGSNTRTKDCFDDPVTASFSVKGRRMRQHFENEDGDTRTNVSTLSKSDTRLKLNVTIKSNYLTKPMVYTLHYCRE